MALAEGDGKKLEDVHRPKGMNEDHYKALKKQAKSIDWTGYDKNKQKVLLGYKNTKKIESSFYGEWQCMRQQTFIRIELTQRLMENGPI